MSCSLKPPRRGAQRVRRLRPHVSPSSSRSTSSRLGSGLKAWLTQAAEAIDATGLIVWVGSAAGADLRAVVAHGYSPQTLARIPSVPRSADNAAASAYRTGATQVVPARSTTERGALV